MNPERESFRQLISFFIIAITCGSTWEAFYEYRSGWVFLAALILTAALAFIPYSHSNHFRRLVHRHAVAGERQRDPFLWKLHSDEEIERKIFGDVIE